MPTLALEVPSNTVGIVRPKLPLRKCNEAYRFESDQTDQSYPRHGVENQKSTVKISTFPSKQARDGII